MIISQAVNSNEIAAAIRSGVWRRNAAKTDAVKQTITVTAAIAQV
jgi:hypothetical protein